MPTPGPSPVSTVSTPIRTFTEATAAGLAGGGAILRSPTAVALAVALVLLLLLAEVGVVGVGFPSAAVPGPGEESDPWEGVGSCCWMVEGEGGEGGRGYFGGGKG